MGFRGAATNVTAITVIGSAGIVNPCAAFEGCSGMTGATIQRCGDVGWVGLGIFTKRYRAVMTGLAIIHDTGMVEPRTDETRGGMTDATVLVCWHMGATCFTFSERTIMTGLTVIHDAYMSKGSWDKARGFVAHAAVLCCWHMVRWRGFPSGSCAIVT